MMFLLLKTSYKKIMKIDILMKQYVNAIIERASLDDEDYIKINKYVELEAQCVCQIKQIPGWTDIFCTLLEHEHVAVRIDTAMILLPYKTKKAKWELWKCRLLDSGIYSFEAGIILQEWRSGELKFPEFNKNGKVVYKSRDELSKN